ncbi:hypothetical protein B0J12DRAFT_658013 [Macrophomina phaseolina]|uniref:Uncharacterized protein n=1 Tax=Macrophomina phaseolina TaxID=35725 RepID=A0ABQ8GGC9_9PEZI|nr:hypothetical protein B0J12DRAFT_658013 [Macrophomina phaseolina]
MRATKLVSVALAALLEVSFMSIAFASPFEKSNGDEIDTTKSRGTGNSTAPTFTTHLIKYATDSSDDSKWGGAVFKQPPSGSFKAIQGSFTVPKASLPAGQAFILAGIGGTNGSNNYWLQVGIFMFVNPN